MDEPLVSAFHHLGFEVAVETNGTLLPPSGIDWTCVSPKAGAELKLQSGDELKLVFPQEGLEPEIFESLDFRFFFLQPKDGPDIQQNPNKPSGIALNTRSGASVSRYIKLIGFP